MLGRNGVTAALDARFDARHVPLIHRGTDNSTLPGRGVPTCDCDYIFNVLVHTLKGFDGS